MEARARRAAGVASGRASGADPARRDVTRRRHAGGAGGIMGSAIPWVMTSPESMALCPDGDMEDE
jgi:hypothetical protein